jgi:RimJ/RimL family protein N-acetyltransferase
MRVATMADVPALEQLITASVRGLNAGRYTQAEMTAALGGVFGVDSQLIADGTYYVLDGPTGPVAAGGWSGRRTLYGGNKMKGAEDPRLDPRTEPARIRAFFVHPDWSRRGLARRLYGECERAARATGFRAFELMATLPGEPLYVALGFSVVERVVVSVSGVDVSFTRMARELLAGDSATFGIRASILTLVPNTLQATRALIAGMDASQRAEVSPDWLARVDSGTADAWTLGYTMVLQGSDASIGMCGFKGPPGADAAVEIAYGVSPEHEGKGYATDAAMWLLAHAFDGGGVFVVRAHTLSNEGASTRVLVKCGFRCMGRVVQPDDGAVWRWEKERSQVLRSAQDS